MGKMSSTYLIFTTMFLVAGLMICCWAREANGASGCISQERNALLKFKASLSDPSNRLSSWNASIDCCSWRGVNCDRITGHVVGLDLPNERRYGDFYYSSDMLHSNTLDFSILDLKQLSFLDLSGNDFQNISIPEFLGSMNQLQHLNLSYAKFSGVVPHHLGNLSHLRVLDISGDYYFTKLIVDDFMWVSRLSSLVHLDMSGVDLSGTKHMLSLLNMLHHVEVVRLSSCGLENGYQEHKFIDSTGISGPIPTSLWNLSSLKHLDLSHNLFHSIPAFIGNLSSLEYLDLSVNSLSGRLPDIWANLKELSALILSSNQFSGAIPDSIGGAYSLKWLQLNGNKFTGKLPLNMGNCTALKALDVGDNSISGELPKWIGSTLVHLQVLTLRNNEFDGTIPLELCQLPVVYLLDFANNMLTGNIPHCFGNFSYMILYSADDKVHSYKAGSIPSMDLSNNNLVGEIPVEFTGLTALHVLSLSHNRLQGEIPGTIGEMKSLESLDLSDNYLSGNIPRSLSCLSFLSSLDLSSNNFVGQIPTGGQLQTLEDPSIYGGNPGLCGAPLLTICVEDGDGASNVTEGDDKADKILSYGIISYGFATGFWGAIGVLVLKKSWGRVYFKFTDRIIVRMFEK